MKKNDINFSDIIVYDDIFPSPMSPFRYVEYSEYMKYFSNMSFFCSGNTLPFFKKHPDINKTIKSFIKEHPEGKNRFCVTDKLHDVYPKLIYVTFLNNVIYNKLGTELKIPFIVNLYPGGGLQLHNEECDNRMKEIFSSSFCKKVIVTQKILRDYLIDNKICPVSKIEFIYGVVTSPTMLEVKEKKLSYGINKNTLDICFVAHKYMPKGTNKGYDTFVEVAKILSQKYDFVNFHVVGGFDENCIDVSDIRSRITFYGQQSEKFFMQFYKDKDIILSPNIPFTLLAGSFDGFPTASVTEAGLHGLTMFVTDELKCNDNFFEENKDIVIIKPDVDDVVRKIEYFLDKPSELKQIGNNGIRKIQSLYSLKAQVKPRIRLIEQELEKIKKSSTDIKLSIVCITYNHEKFIKEALEGFVMQKTNFPFEVIIHDDASTDKTADIIREYQKRYPEIIKPIFQTSNKFSQGKMPIIEYMLDKIQGEYVALCEGDDYWTDENKLQKQVDFLDSHPDFSICFHPVKFVWEDKSHKSIVFPAPKDRFNKTVLKLKHLLKQNFIQTNSVVYRWNLKKSDWPQRAFLPCDWYFHLLHARHGKIGLLPEVMSVYRKHSGGVWYGCGETDDWYIKNALLSMRFYDEVAKNFRCSKNVQLQSIAASSLPILLKHSCYDELKKMFDEFPHIFNELYYNGKKVKKLRKEKKALMWCFGILLFVFIVFLLMEYK